MKEREQKVNTNKKRETHSNLWIVRHFPSLSEENEREIQNREVLNGAPEIQLVKASVNLNKLITYQTNLVT